ncbi:MAG: ribonuclease HII, partial [Eggerthellaceae bacterium]|nr:ribonuclease HII [Eggerthellaceae bacterium]
PSMIQDVGLDEVGRGAVAGPLAVGAVVLDREMPPIKCLDDSKKLKSEVRERVSRDVKASCLASCVVYVEPEAIDEMGISNALRQAFKEAVSKIEQAGITPDVILLDGNPMHLDSREVNVVKGDSRCASIAAASVIAKVERDALMTSLDESFPGYQFAQNKGYGTSDHMCAIEQKGLSTIHRRSFLTKMEQETLF